MINSNDGMDRLDRGSFKAFRAAAETLNFTAAAERAAMTQSGVSQHVAKLERQLGAQLFIRINRRVQLTKAGVVLLEFIEQERDRTDDLFEEIHGEANRISGVVRYGMPHSCLFTPHFSLLLEQRKGLEDVDLEVRLCPNDVVFEKLLDQRIDFGFVTRTENNPAIRFEFFCREEYILVGNDGRSFRRLVPEDLSGSRFVSYPGMDALFDVWARHHFRGAAPAYSSLKIAGSIDSLHGAVTMLKHGVGLAVIPKHCVEGDLLGKSLRELSGPNKKPLLNDVSIVSLEGRRPPRRVAAVMDVFRRMRKG